MSPLDRPVVRCGDLLEERFFLERVIGSGGMGFVYEAVDIACGETVVVKVLRRAQATKAGARRLRREAQTASAAASAQVVVVKHIGEHKRIPFLVLERLQGTDLATYTRKRGPLPVSVACAFLREAALGAAAVHRQGLVHRDIKPSNLFVTEGTAGLSVKLIDFGIAKRTDGPIEEATTALTRVGEILGSLGYMAPEQATHAPDVDERADVWSLGATLYFLLTGVSPFSGRGVASIVGALLFDQHVPLEEKRPDVPVALARLVDACLAKEPAERLGSAALLASLLTPFAGERGHVQGHMTLRAAQRAGQRLSTVVRWAASWSARIERALRRWLAPEAAADLADEVVTTRRQRAA